MLFKQGSRIFISLLMVFLWSNANVYAQGGADPLWELPIPGPDNTAEFDENLFSKIDGTSVDYTEFIIDEEALADLGKILFWDMQLGSDGIQSCASCHFHAGVDNRSKNQLNPGPGDHDNSFELGGPNYQLAAADFPFHKLSDPFDRKSTVISSVNEVASSQGVIGTTFLDIISGSPVDSVHVNRRDRPFQMGNFQTRRVEPRNTPSSINAVFNFRNFWDGRANNNFNGVNPFGNRDTEARVVRDDGSGPVLSEISVVLSSLASQAVGPPLSGFEMSAEGRTFPKIGKKMLDPGIVPLGLQVVDNTDSRLSSYSNDDGTGTIPGVNKSYRELIQAAVHPQWWDSDAIITFSEASNGTLVPAVAGTGSPVGTDEYDLMEANFSMIFGLAVQAYEQELVSDNTPFDHFADGVDGAMTEAQERGFDIFRGKGLCDKCHDGTTFSGATLENLGLGDEPDPDDVDGIEIEQLVERMGLAIHEAYATAVFGVGNIPTMAAGIEAKPLRADPRGAFLEIKSTSTGELMFSGILPGMPEPFPFMAPCVEAEAEIILDIISPSIDPLLGVAEAGFELNEDCTAIFEIGVEGIDVGDYRIFVDGKKWAEISVLVEAVYDNGFYNIGVRDGAEDIGLGGTDPFGNPLSFTEMELLMPGRSDIREGIPGGFLGGDSDPNPPIGSLGEKAAVLGAFKVPILRNLELTAPYFHNGGQRTIEEVVLFYNRGGDFSDNNLVALDPEIVPLDLTQEEIDDLVDFLENGLTDQRVVTKSAPFDHPQLFVPDGHSTVDGVTILAEISAVGAGGGPPIVSFLEGAVAPVAGASAPRMTGPRLEFSQKTEEGETPFEFDLAQNYPNPFNPTTTIRFSLAKDINVNLEIFNMLGQRVKTLLSGQMEAGLHTVSWDGTGDSGEQLASGVYIYKLQTPNFEHSRTMSLTK